MSDMLGLRFPIPDVHKAALEEGQIINCTDLLSFDVMLDTLGKRLLVSNKSLMASRIGGYS